MKGRGRREGQAMVEFAMVLPVMMAIIFVVIAVSTIYAIKIVEQKSTYNGAVHIARLSGDPNLPHPAPFETIDRLKAGVLTNPDYWSADASDTVHARQVSNEVREAQSRVLPKWVRSFVYDDNVVCPGALNNPEVKTGPGLSDPGFFAVQSLEVRYCYRLKNIPGWDVLSALWGNQKYPGLIEERALAARLPSEF